MVKKTLPLLTNERKIIRFLLAQILMLSYEHLHGFVAAYGDYHKARTVNLRSMQLFWLRVNYHKLSNHVESISLYRQSPCLVFAKPTFQPTTR